MVTRGERAGDVTPGQRTPLTEPGPQAEPGDAGIGWQRPSPRLLRARRIQAGLATVPAALAAGLILGIAASPGLGLGTGAMPSATTT